MKKRMIFCLLLLLCLFCIGCERAGDAVPYAAEHRHVYGFWYEAVDSEGQQVRVRYCKICHESEQEP